MTDHVLKVCILGHSFTSRADRYLRDMGIENLNLPRISHNISLNGRGGAHFSDLIEMFNQTGVLQPDILVLDFGTNDLFNSNLVPTLSLARQYFNLAKHMLDHYGVKHIIILEVLPRTSWGRYGAPHSFSARVISFNNAIKSLVLHLDHTAPITFWFNKGFPSKIESFISDGCHLNAEGMAKYIKSIRRAVIKVSRSLRL